VTVIRESRLWDQPSLHPELDQELYKRFGWGKDGPSDEEAEEVIAACKADPAVYVFNFVRTFDAADRKNRVKPFPDYAYLQEMLAYIHAFDLPDDDCDVVAIAKSRQLTMTWLACAYATWEARFHEHSLVMVQSKKAEDAWPLVYNKDWLRGRSAFIERTLPPFLRARGLIGTRGELSYPNGSNIKAVAQGPAQFRSYTASLVICDECTYQDEFREGYQAGTHMARRMLLIATARYGHYFGELIEQNESQEEAA